MPAGAAASRPRAPGSPTGMCRGRASPRRRGTWPSPRATSSAGDGRRDRVALHAPALRGGPRRRPTSRSSPGTGWCRSRRRSCPGRATSSCAAPSTVRACHPVVRQGCSARRVVAGRPGGVARRAPGAAGIPGAGGAAGEPELARSPDARLGRLRPKAMVRARPHHPHHVHGVQLARVSQAARSVDRRARRAACRRPPSPGRAARSRASPAAAGRRARRGDARATSTIPATRPMRPVSSSSSRTTASSGRSPKSIPPPGSVHHPGDGSPDARRQQRSRSPSRQIAYAATRTRRTPRRSSAGTATARSVQGVMG